MPAQVSVRNSLWSCKQGHITTCVTVSVLLERASLTGESAGFPVLLGKFSSGRLAGFCCGAVQWTRRRQPQLLHQLNRNWSAHSSDNVPLSSPGVCLSNLRVTLGTWDAGASETAFGCCRLVKNHGLLVTGMENHVWWCLPALGTLLLNPTAEMDRRKRRVHLGRKPQILRPKSLCVPNRVLRGLLP